MGNKNKDSHFCQSYHFPMRVRVMLILEFTDSGTTTESDRPGRQPNAKENRHSLERKNARGDPRFPNGTNRVLGPEKSLNRAHG